MTRVIPLSAAESAKMQQVRRDIEARYRQYRELQEEWAMLLGKLKEAYSAPRGDIDASGKYLVSE